MPTPRPSPWFRIASAACGAVYGADALQLVLLEWTPARWGAVGGAVLYLAFAIGLFRRRRWAAIGAILVPVLPLTLTALWLVGVSTPREPDAWMLGILVLQLVAAGASVALLGRQALPRT